MGLVSFRALVELPDPFRQALPQQPTVRCPQTMKHEMKVTDCGDPGNGEQNRIT